MCEIRRDGLHLVLIGREAAVPYILRNIFGQVVDSQPLGMIYPWHIGRELARHHEANSFYLTVSPLFAAGAIRRRTLARRPSSGR